ncbi:MAG: proline dehydrogenase [Terriglobia bacterium]|nr:MAG: proline dehydrogenase [Terriglobia bacterium]
MRSLFLFLSRRQRLRKWVETSPLAQRLSSRFVAGETLDDALRVGRRINSEGIYLTLDHLGESVTSLEEAARARDVYLHTLSAIHENRICGNVSLKLTQFGMDFSVEQCRANVAQLIERAASLGSFVRVDMESSEYTDRTLALVEDLHGRYGCVGTVIQSYLRRSRADVERLCDRRIRVRLCKGAYLEPAEIAFTRKADVDLNYIELMKLLLDRGEYPAIATHDERIIIQTKAYASERGIPLDRFEFQMLYGIRRDLQRRLVSEGYRLRLYVPFGKAWYPYFMRRLAERPANVFFLARNLLRQ